MAFGCASERFLLWSGEWVSKLGSLCSQPWVALLVGFLAASHRLRMAKSQGVSLYRWESDLCSWSLDCQSHGARQCRGFLLMAGRTVVGSDGSPELVRVGTLNCVGVPLRPVADGGLFVCLGSVAVPGTLLMEARLSKEFNQKLSGEAFDSITTLPPKRGDLGFRTTDEAPSRSAVQALLGRSLSGEAEQEDEGMETPCGILPIVRTPGGGVGSAEVRGSWGRGSAGQGHQSSGVAPRGGRGRASTPRAGSSVAIQLQMLEALRSFGSRITALEQQTVIQPPVVRSSTFLGARCRGSTPSRRRGDLQGWELVLGIQPTSPGDLPLPECRRQAEAGFNLEVTFAASTEKCSLGSFERGRPTRKGSSSLTIGRRGLVIPTVCAHSVPGRREAPIYERACAFLIHCFTVAEPAAKDPAHSLEWMWPVLGVPDPEAKPDHDLSPRGSRFRRGSHRTLQIRMR